MSTLLTNMKHTAQAVCDGYERWEIDAVMAPRTQDCIHHLGPKSLGRPLRNNEQYSAYFSTVQTLFHDFKVGRLFYTSFYFGMKAKDGIADTNYYRSK